MITLHDAVSESVHSRGMVANVSVFAPFVHVSRKVAWPSGRVDNLSTAFRFDGDMVLLRGLSKALDDLAGKVNQAEHVGAQAL